MRFTIKRILLIMVVSMASLGWLKPAHSQTRVACVGDSITYGVNLASNQTYPAFLQTLLGSGYNVQNFGYPGLSLMSLPGGNPSYHPAYTSTTQYSAAINFNPNIVIIMLGTNDASFAPNAGQTWAQTYESMFISQYQSLIGAFKNCPAHPVVYVALCTRIAGSNSYGIDPTVLNSVIVPELSTIAAAASAPVVNFFAASSPYGNAYQDNVHPTATLTQIMANSAYASIQQYASAPPTTPAAPSAVTATPGNGGVQLSWTAPAGWVSAYNVYRSTTAGGEGTTPYAAGLPGYLTNYVDSGATNGSTYYYKVAAVNSAASGAQSAEVHGAPASTLYAGLPYGALPSVPGTIFADNYDLGGQGIGYNSGSAWNFGGFDRFYEGVGMEVNTDSPTNGFDVGWTAAGQWLNYSVNVAATGTYLVGFRVASGGTGGTLHLESATGANLTGSVTVPATGGWQTWATVNATATLPVGRQALKVVQDSGGYNINAMTFSTSSIPSAPTGLAATAGNAQVSLTWNASTGATSYNVYRATTAGGEGTTAIATGIAATSYVNTGLTNGTTYYYKVAAVNSLGTSAQSTEANAKPTGPVEAPYGGTAAAVPGTVQAENYDTGGQGLGYSVTAVNGSANSYRTDGVDLETCTDTGNGYDMGWTGTGQWFRYTVNVATAGIYVVGFRISSGGTGGTLHLQNAAGTNLTGTVTVPGTGGWQTWTTVNALATLPAGQQVLTVYQDTGGYNINLLTFTKQTAPAAPVGLTATAGTAQVSLSWTASSGAASYNVYRSTTAGGEGTTAIATGITSTTYVNTGLTNGTTYFYKVAAVNASGTSSQSNEASATPAASTGPIANGTYTLTPQNATGSRLDATNGSNTSGTQLQIWTAAANNPNQKWIFTYMGGGYYKIQPSYNTGLAVGVAGNGSANATAVQLLTDNGATGQRWQLTAVTGGYTLTPQCATGSTLNVSGPSSADGTPIIIWQATGGTNTIFSIGTN